MGQWDPRADLVLQGLLVFLDKMANLESVELKAKRGSQEIVTVYLKFFLELVDLAHQE